MKSFRLCGQLAAVLGCGLGLAAHAVPSLETINGIVAGAGRCGTWGPAPELSFFTFAPADVAVGGIAACGYSGGYQMQSAAIGPLTRHDSLGPVILGPPAHSLGFYSGTADARSSYGSRGAAAHSDIAGGVPQSNLALFDSVAAATFSDTLTATSPLVASSSVGSVRYQFRVDGRMTSLGAPAAFLFGENYAVLDVKQGNGPVVEVMNAHVRRGGLGTISNTPPPAGWVTSTGILSGSSVFYSVALPMLWGQPWDLKVGLLAWSYGTADSQFLNTATLSGFEFFDADGVAVNDFSLSSASGTDYLNPVPEPSAAALLPAGIALLARRRPSIRGRAARRPADPDGSGPAR